VEAPIHLARMPDLWGSRFFSPTVTQLSHLFVFSSPQTIYSNATPRLVRAYIAARYAHFASSPLPVGKEV